MARRRNLAGEPLVRAVRLVREEVPGFEAYPFSIPAIRALHELELHRRAQIRMGYRMVESLLAAGPWVCGEVFTLADCSAAPELAYGDAIEPIGADHPRTAAYLKRLQARPSFARVLTEAAPVLKYFPLHETFLEH